MGSKPSKDAEDIAIDRFIQRMLEKSETNCASVPDFIERAMYKKVMRHVLSVLKELVTSVRIEFADHVITLHLNPKIDVPTEIDV